MRDCHFGSRAITGAFLRGRGPRHPPAADRMLGPLAGRQPDPGILQLIVHILIHCVTDRSAAARRRRHGIGDSSMRWRAHSGAAADTPGTLTIAGKITVFPVQSVD